MNKFLDNGIILCDTPENIRDGESIDCKEYIIEKVEIEPEMRMLGLSQMLPAYLPSVGLDLSEYSLESAILAIQQYRNEKTLIKSRSRKSTTITADAEDKIRVLGLSQMRAP
jgi:hypothetical protein